MISTLENNIFLPFPSLPYSLSSFSLTFLPTLGGGHLFTLLFNIQSN